MVLELWQKIILIGMAVGLFVGIIISIIVYFADKDVKDELNKGNWLALFPIAFPVFSGVLFGTFGGMFACLIWRAL